MKKIIIILFLATIVFSPFFIVSAQEDKSQIELNPSIEIKAVAGEDKNVVIDRQIVFSAVNSRVPAGAVATYSWHLGDGTILNGEEVLHVYRRPGVYSVQLFLTVFANGQQLTDKDEVVVNVDQDIFLLISDKTVAKEELKAMQEFASQQGILLANVQEVESSLDYVEEKELMLKILKNQENLRQASAIIIWTEKNIGLNAFLEAAQQLTRGEEAQITDLSGFGFNNKFFVVITDQNFSATARVAQSLYNLLDPRAVVLTREEAKNTVIAGNNIESLLDQLRRGEVDYRLVGLHTQRELRGLRPWNFMSYLVGYMVDRGVPLNTIYLILVLPIIATIVAFSRQIVGFKALGIYTPSIIAVLFLVTGLKYGLLIFFVTLLVGTFGRMAARKIRLSYLPRMAIVLTIICLVLFALFWAGASLKGNDLIGLSIFPVLIMVLLTEKFISVQVERGSKHAIMLIIETLALSIVCYWLASWQILRIFVLGYPEYILLTIVVNLLIGKWTGLRLIEYYRFRKVIKNVELAEKK